MWHWLKTGGRPEAARRDRWRRRARRILSAASALETLSDAELTAQAGQKAWEVRAGLPMQRAVEDVFALVCEAARRSVNMRPYEVQVMGGLALSEGRIAEMQTGEGKTLTATMPVTLYAMAGRGCHVVTVNDYLAGRDADLMRPVYRLMGLTVGCVTSDSEPEDRGDAYSRDITYGTAQEIGFDFLRDRLHRDSIGSPHQLPRYAAAAEGNTNGVQRGHYFALIDEADSILIDEAGTPLIIGLPERNRISTVSLLHWARSLVDTLQEGEDYTTEPDRRLVELTDQGNRRVIMAARPHWLAVFSNEKIWSQVETAIEAELFYRLDREYVVHEGEIVIVDESTGRMMEGRKWQRGLHQAVEVKEAVVVTETTHHAAQVTVQSFFRQYRFLAGMTGTAVQARRELRKVYSIGVSAIPTNERCVRREIAPEVFATDDDRNHYLVEQVVELVRQKRAVLIGTPSVQASEELGRMLTRASVSHVILNARHEAEEAKIVEKAGRPGRVSIATNMAGRGTDIIPQEDVLVGGGLHVIGTSIHSSARIDRQLVGRTARQGNPGTFQFLLSLQDPFLQILSGRAQGQLERTIQGRQAQLEVDNRALNVGRPLSRGLRRYFIQAQRRLEKVHGRVRKQMLKSERQQQEAFRRIGLDPYLECVAD